jgi:hypothetical protein
MIECAKDSGHYPGSWTVPGCVSALSRNQDPERKSFARGQLRVVPAFRSVWAAFRSLFLQFSSAWICRFDGIVGPRALVASRASSLTLYSRLMRHSPQAQAISVRRSNMIGVDPSLSSVMLGCFKSRPGSTVRNEISKQSRWIIRSGSLPGPASQPRGRRDVTGRRIPTIGRPSVSFSDVFPSTRCSDRPWLGK